MESSRPHLTVPLRPLDWLLEAVAAAASLAMIALPALFWSDLPPRVPIHFNVSGQPDGWGGRATLLVLPAVGVLVFGGLTLIARSPHRFNYVVDITPENAAAEYAAGARLLRALKAGVAILLADLLRRAIRVATGGAETLGASFTFVLVAVIGGPIICYFTALVGRRRGSSS